MRGIHALSATGRTFESKYKGPGFITPDEEVVAVAGSGHGADTAGFLKPAFGASMFETKIKALLCMPA